MRRKPEQILRDNLRENQTRKWKFRSQILGFLLIITSGLIFAIGVVDNIITQNIVSTPIMDEQIAFFISGEGPQDYLDEANYRDLERFSRSFIGKVHTRCVLILLSIEFEPQMGNPPQYFSFLLNHENLGIVENLTLSLELLFQLKEIGSGITLEANGDPGEFELGAVTHPFSSGWRLEFHLFVQAIVLSPQVEYLGSVFSLLLAGITLLLFESVKWILDQMIFTTCGLCGMVMGTLLFRYLTYIYSFYNLQYLGTTFILFIVCLNLVFKGYSKYNEESLK